MTWIPNWAARSFMQWYRSKIPVVGRFCQAVAGGCPAKSCLLLPESQPGASPGTRIPYPPRRSDRAATPKAPDRFVDLLAGSGGPQGAETGGRGEHSADRRPLRLSGSPSPPVKGDLRRITLLGSRVNKALAGVAHTKKKPEPPCRGLRLRCATSSSLEEVRSIYPTALSG